MKYAIKTSCTPCQKPMRDILGMNNIPRISNIKFRDFEVNLFEKLNVSHVRFHDAPVENAAQNIIDIHRIFPLFHLDETDIRNYFFDQTDDYLAMLEGVDIEIDFRLGETIDHSLNGRLIAVPEDIDKWARVCRNIIGHYKNGEMNGMHLNITRVTIWEEPDNNHLFGGNVEDYSQMFCAVYKLLKKDFPSLKVGGPTMMTGQIEFMTKFIKYCQSQDVTPDYISSTLYSANIDFIGKTYEEYRRAVESCGVSDIMHTISEWHMAPKTWDFTSLGACNTFFTTENAAFTCRALIKFMDIDYIDVAYYYAWATSMWSVMHLRNPEGVTVLPVYYGLLLFQAMAKDCKERVEIYTDKNDNISSIAGLTSDGKLRILVACHNSEECTLSFDVKGAKKCNLRLVKENFCDTDALEAADICKNDGIFEVLHEGASGVYLLEFEY